jgi:putative ABC transport system ATP-binding protein
MAPRDNRLPQFNTPVSEPDGCPGDPLIQMMDIVKTFKTPSGDFTALKGITACFYRGEFVSVVGKSGSGKSTLVNMITGIDHPSSGRVRIGDTYVHTLNENKMSIWRGRNLGIVFQFFQLLPMLSLLENVVLPMDFCNMFAPEAREPRAMELLERVGLQDFAHKLPGAVSGGQQQSAAIARALANDPPILIADEPTGNLDSRTADSVFSLISQLVEAGKTVIMVTHDASLASRTDRSMILSDGELVNEWVAKAFPSLPHPRLLWLSHQLQPVSFEPGQPLGLQTSSEAGLYLVTNGQLEISLNHGRRADAPPVRLGPGDYLSELELQTAGDLLAGMRAGGGEPLELLALDSGGFARWMQEASRDQSRLKQTAEQRKLDWEQLDRPALVGQRSENEQGRP